MLLAGLLRLYRFNDRCVDFALLSLAMLGS